MKNVSNPIIIDQYYCDSSTPCANQVKNSYFLFRKSKHCPSGFFILNLKRSCIHILVDEFRFDVFTELFGFYMYHLSWYPDEMQTSAVKMDNISFENIKGTSATKDAIIFACSNDVPCEGLYLKDIQLVSQSSGVTSSFCWNACGSSAGLVFPPACFTCTDGLIQQYVSSSYALTTEGFIQQNVSFNYAFQSFWREISLF